MNPSSSSSSSSSIPFIENDDNFIDKIDKFSFLISRFNLENFIQTNEKFDLTFDYLSTVDKAYRLRKFFREIVQGVNFQEISDDIGKALLDLFFFRLSRVVNNTLLIIHLQLSTRSYWLAHSSGQDFKELDDFTCFGFIPFRMDYRNSAMIYDDAMRGDEIGFFTQMQKDISLDIQNGIRPSLRCFLFNRRVLEPTSLKKFQHTEHPLSYAQQNAKYLNACRFFTQNLYHSAYFAYVLSKTPNTIMVQNQFVSQSVLVVPPNNFTEKKPDFTSENFFTDFAMQIVHDRTNYLAYIKNPLQSFDDQTGVVAVDATLRFTPVEMGNFGHVKVERNSRWFMIYLQRYIVDASLLLNQLDITVNSIEFNDMDICLEAQMESLMVSEVMFGPNSLYTRFEEESIAALSNIYSSFDILPKNLITPRFTYHNYYISKVAVWMIVLKLILRHGFVSNKSFKLFEAIFIRTLYFYRIFSGRDLSSDVSNDDLASYHRALYAVLFANPYDIAAFIDHGYPLLIPQFIHVGFYTVHCLAKFMLDNRNGFKPTSKISMDFKYCLSQRNTFDLILEKESPLSEQIEEYIASSMKPVATLKDLDWGFISEADIGRSFKEAQTARAPIVVFGSNVLPLESLGNAARAIYLGFSLKDPNGQNFYEDGVLGNLMKHNDPRIANCASMILNLRKNGVSSKHRGNLKRIIDGLVNFTVRKNKLSIDQHIYDNILKLTLSYKKRLLANPMIQLGVLRDFTLVTPSERVKRISYGDKGLYYSTNAEIQVIKNGLNVAASSKKHVAKRGTQNYSGDQFDHTFLTDILLLIWFIQSPVFHAKKEISDFVLFHNKKQIFSRIQRKSLGATPTLSAIVVNRADYSMFSDENYPSSYLTLSNVDKNGAVQAIALSENTFLISDKIVYRSFKKNRLSVEIPEVFEAKYIEGAYTLSLSVPSLEYRMKYDPLILSPLLCFKTRFNSFLFPVTAAGHIPSISGLSIERVFVGFPLDFSSITNQTITRTTHRFVMLLTYIFDTIIPALNIEFKNGMTNVIFSQNYSPFTIPSQRDIFNKENARGFFQFVSEIALNENRQDSTYNSLINKLSGIGFHEDIISSFVLKHFIKAYNIPERFDMEYSKSHYGEFTSNPNVRSRTSILIGNVNATNDRLEGKPSHITSNDESISITVNWPLVSTFLAHEYQVANRKEYPLNFISPLVLFRLIAIAFCDTQIRKDDAVDLLVRLNPNYVEKTYKLQDIANSIPQIMSPSEFYAPIDGYVTGGNDKTLFISKLQRGKAHGDYRVSQRLFKTQTLKNSQDVLINNNRIPTGMSPVFDFSVVVTPNVPSKRMVWDYVRTFNVKEFIHLSYDNLRKEWFVRAVQSLPKETLVGFIAGEISPIDLVVESADIVDPGVDLNLDIKQTVDAFTDSVTHYCGRIFDKDVLYPVDKFCWFQFTGVTSETPVLYSESKYANWNRDENVYCYDINGKRDITEKIIDNGQPDVSSAAYRVRRKICGYEIRATRFSNSIRYVRYTNNPDLANVSFKRITRENIARFEEHSELSYWGLVTTRDVEINEELVVLIPPSGSVDWIKFLITGYPSGELETALAFDLFHGCWGHRVKPVFAHIHYRYGYTKGFQDGASSALPIFPPRMLCAKREKELLDFAKLRSVAATSSGLIDDRVSELESVIQFVQKKSGLHTIPSIKDDIKAFYENMKSQGRNYYLNMVGGSVIYPKIDTELLNEDGFSLPSFEPITPSMPQLVDDVDDIEVNDIETPFSNEDLPLTDDLVFNSLFNPETFVIDESPATTSSSSSSSSSSSAANSPKENDPNDFFHMIETSSPATSHNDNENESSLFTEYLNPSISDGLFMNSDEDDTPFQFSQNEIFKEKKSNLVDDLFDAHLSFEKTNNTLTRLNKF